MDGDAYSPAQRASLDNTALYCDPGIRKKLGLKSRMTDNSTWSAKHQKHLEQGNIVIDSKGNPKIRGIQHTQSDRLLGKTQQDRGVHANRTTANPRFRKGKYLAAKYAKAVKSNLPSKTNRQTHTGA